MNDIYRDGSQLRQELDIARARSAQLERDRAEMDALYYRQREKTAAERARAEKAEADAAVMREHLELMIRIIGDAAPGAFDNGVTGDSGPDQGEVMTWACVRRAEAALASDAGATLLARLARYEKVLSHIAEGSDLDPAASAIVVLTGDQT